MGSASLRWQCEPHSCGGAPVWRSLAAVAAVVAATLGAGRGADRRAAHASAGHPAAGTGAAGDLQELHVLPRHRRLRVQRARPRRLERLHRRAAQGQKVSLAAAGPRAAARLAGRASSARRTKPFPRTYVAQEVTTFFSDAEADDLLKRSCTGCHDDRSRERGALQPRPLARGHRGHARARGQAGGRRAGTAGRVARPDQGHEPEPMSRFALTLLVALTPAAVGAQTGETIFTATSANVAAPGAAVKIRIQRWSTPDEATPLVTALNPPPAPARRGGASGDDGRAAGAGRLPVAARAGADVAPRRRHRSAPRRHWRSPSDGRRPSAICGRPT